MLGGRGLAVESDLAQTRVKLDEAQEQVKSVERVVTVDLTHATVVSFLRLSLTPSFSSVALARLLLVLQGLEEMSSRKSCFLWMEHARFTELERELESAHCESQDWVAEVTEPRAAEQLTMERATAAERGLEAVKVRQEEAEAALQKSLVDTKAALQSTLETLEAEQKALESERKARSEVDQEVLAL